MGQIFNRIKRIIKSNLLEENESFTSATFWDDEEQLKREFDEALRNTQQNNQSTKPNFQDISLEMAYKILGVESTATFEEIKIAYKRRVKQYHPDLIENMGQELQDLAKQKIQEINFAFDLIKKSRGL